MKIYFGSSLNALLQTLDSRSQSCSHNNIKHLKEFSFSCEHFLFAPPPLESFLSLPIRTLTTDNLKFEEGRIEEIVNTLSNMKSLIQIRFVEHTSFNYKLSPKEFSLFKRLPITSVNLATLNLRTKRNLRKFGRIMKKIEICIVCVLGEK